MLPSCSPGVFRQKSFRSSTPPRKAPIPAPTSLAARDGRATPVIATNNRYVPRAATPTVTTIPVAPPRDSVLRAAVGTSLSRSSLSRGARATSKHARLGPVLASKMASASSSTVVQGWPNTKDDYELKEVIGEYRSLSGIVRSCADRAVERKVACAFQSSALSPKTRTGATSISNVW